VPKDGYDEYFEVLEGMSTMDGNRETWEEREGRGVTHGGYE